MNEGGSVKRAASANKTKVPVVCSTPKRDPGHFLALKAEKFRAFRELLRLKRKFTQQMILVRVAVFGGVEAKEISAAGEGRQLNGGMLSTNRRLGRLDWPSIAIDHLQGKSRWAQSFHVEMEFDLSANGDHRSCFVSPQSGEGRIKRSTAMPIASGLTAAWLGAASLPVA
jgi:hypothetical protein